jgi:hypothetical protein
MFMDIAIIRGLTIKFTNSPPCAYRGSSEQKPQFGLIRLAYQRSTAVSLLTYDSLFLSVFWCAVAGMSEQTLNFLLHLQEWKRNQRDVSANFRR